MKMIIFLSVLSVAVMVVMLGQVVHQELNHRFMKNLMKEKVLEISRREQGLTDMKKVIQGLHPELNSVATLTEELKKKKDDAQNAKNALEERLGTCTKEKTEIEKSKTEVTESIGKLKNDHAAAKDGAMKTIDDLKQKTLDRDKAICALVDRANDEARKLCGFGDMAPQ